MRLRILAVLAVIVAALGLAAVAAPASARPVLLPSTCQFNTAHITETYGAYGIGATSNGDVGSFGTEVLKPGWDICTYQHADGSWNLYLSNGNELASTYSCAAGVGSVVVKAAGSEGTAWTLGGPGPDHYTWMNNACPNGFLAGTDLHQNLALCFPGGDVDCNQGYYRTWTMKYE